MPAAILRLPQVRQRVGLSRSEIYRRMALGEFPARVSLGPRAVGWLEDEITRWIETRVQQDREAAA